MCMYPQYVPSWTQTPFTLRRKKDKSKDPNNFMQVPCGKCPDCKRLRAMSWSFRLQQEYKDSANGLFLTLTYKDEELPYTDNGVETLDYKHLQLFFKNLRRQTQYLYSTHEPEYRDSKKDVKYDLWNRLKESKIKYYAVGEYGGQTQRPHYHAIIFNVPNEIKKKISTIWGRGQIKVGTVTEKSIRYVANYIMVNKQDPDIREPESARMSKGLGIGYFENNENFMRKRISATIPYNGHEIPMPKYYRDKVFIPEEKTIIGEKNAERYHSKKQEQYKEWIKKGLDPEEQEEQIKQEKIRKFLKNKKARL